MLKREREREKKAKKLNKIPRVQERRQAPPEVVRPFPLLEAEEVAVSGHLVVVVVVQTFQPAEWCQVEGLEQQQPLLLPPGLLRAARLKLPVNI